MEPGARQLELPGVGAGWLRPAAAGMPAQAFRLSRFLARAAPGSGSQAQPAALEPAARGPSPANGGTQGSGAESGAGAEASLASSPATAVTSPAAKNSAATPSRRVRRRTEERDVREVGPLLEEARVYVAAAGLAAQWASLRAGAAREVLQRLEGWREPGAFRRLRAHEEALGERLEESHAKLTALVALLRALGLGDSSAACAAVAEAARAPRIKLGGAGGSLNARGAIRRGRRRRGGRSRLGGQPPCLDSRHLFPGSARSCVARGRALSRAGPPR